MPVLPRRSVDSKVCAFGRSLLSLCMSSDLIIVNGRVQGDEMGAHTCHISQGSSLVDYFIVSSSLMAAVSSLTVLDQRLVSDHCPLKLMLHLQAAQSKSAGRLPEDAKSEHQSMCRTSDTELTRSSHTGKPFVSFLNLSSVCPILLPVLPQLFKSALRKLQLMFLVGPADMPAQKCNSSGMMQNVNWRVPH